MVWRAFLQKCKGFPYKIFSLRKMIYPIFDETVFHFSMKFAFP